MPKAMPKAQAKVQAKTKGAGKRSRHAPPLAPDSVSALVAAHVPVTPKHAGGRPIRPDRDDIMRRVCDRISTGEIVLKAAPAEGISADMIYQWGMLPEYAQMYTQARVNQAHALAEQTITLSDDALHDPETVAARRLMVDTRKWFTGKIARRIYGDAVDITSNGETFESLLARTQIVPTAVATLSSSVPVVDGVVDAEVVDDG